MGSLLGHGLGMFSRWHVTGWLDGLPYGVILHGGNSKQCFQRTYACCAALIEYIGLNGRGKGKTKDDPAATSQIKRYQDGDGQWFDGTLVLTGHRTIPSVTKVTKRYLRSVIKVDEIGKHPKHRRR